MRYPKLTSLLLSALLPLTLARADSSSQRDLLSYVNPLIGTANGGNVFPGAVVPFGMVQFSPEESPAKPGRQIAAPGGYEYGANKIRGFSLTNVEGWGCAGGSGDVPILPITEAVDQSPSVDFRHAYASNFSHETEHARAGHYNVLLANGVDVDLTASLHTGAAVFRFPKNSLANVLIRTSDSEVG